MLYFDYAASSPLRVEALEVLNQSFAHDFANPSASHKLGKQLNKKIIKSKKRFLKYLNAPEYQFIFTASATESANTFFRGLAIENYLYTDADHSSLVKISGLFKKENQYRYKILPTGHIDIKDLIDKLGQAPILVALTMINGQTGAFNNVEEISKKIKKINPKAKIFVDAAQGFLKHPLNLSSKEIDAVGVSAQKMGGPKGVAGLYLKKGLGLQPLLLGGDQDEGVRSSTMAAPLIFSFDKAAEILAENQKAENLEVEKLSLLFVNTMKEKIGSVKFPFLSKEKSPYIECLILPGVSSDILMRHLEIKNIFVSSTAACSSKIKGFNPTLSALGVQESEHKSVLRVSFSASHTMQDIQDLCDELTAIFNELCLLKGKNK